MCWVLVRSASRRTDGLTAAARIRKKKSGIGPLPPSLDPTPSEQASFSQLPVRSSFTLCARGGGGGGLVAPDLSGGRERRSRPRENGGRPPSVSRFVLRRRSSPPVAEKGTNELKRPWKRDDMEKLKEKVDPGRGYQIPPCLDAIKRYIHS